MKDNTTPIQTRPSTDDDHAHAAHAMVEEGGSFAKYIGYAYFVGDSHNRARLRAAFPDLFTEFYIKHVMRDI